MSAGEPALLGPDAVPAATAQSSVPSAWHAADGQPQRARRRERCAENAG
jgi:hypothetical protein